MIILGHGLARRLREEALGLFVLSDPWGSRVSLVQDWTCNNPGRRREGRQCLFEGSCAELQRMTHGSSACKHMECSVCKGGDADCD